MSEYLKNCFGLVFGGLVTLVQLKTGPDRTFKH